MEGFSPPSSQAKCLILAYSNLPLGRIHSDWYAIYRPVRFTVLHRPKTNHIWSTCVYFSEKKFCALQSLNRRPQDNTIVLLDQLFNRLRHGYAIYHLVVYKTINI
jgi:hypothetical protein